VDRADPGQDLAGQQPADPEQIGQRRARRAHRGGDLLTGGGDAGVEPADLGDQLGR
jgi:hypothetical protein